MLSEAVLTPSGAAALLESLDDRAEAVLDAALGGAGSGRAALGRRAAGAPGTAEEEARLADLERRAFSAGADASAGEELALLRARIREREEALDAAVAELRRAGIGARAAEETGGSAEEPRDASAAPSRRRLPMIAALVAGVLGVAALGVAASAAAAPRPSLEVFTEPWSLPAGVDQRPLSTLASLRVFHWGPTRYLGTVAGIDYFASLSLDSFSAAELAEESVCLYGLSRELDGRVVVTNCEATTDFAVDGMTVGPDDYQGDSGGAGVRWGPTGGIRSAG